MSHLRGEITFGLNRIYLMFEKLGFATTHLVSINSLVIEQCVDEMLAQPCRKFLSWRNHRRIGPANDVVFLRSVGRPRFCADVHRRGVAEGNTVTYVAMQLAYYMGIEEVILIGVDHSFATTGPPHKTIIAQGDDADHFDPQYFTKGFRWQLPDLDSSEAFYRIARKAFERDGRRIVDATVGGKLEVFPKVAYESLWP